MFHTTFKVYLYPNFFLYVKGTLKKSIALTFGERSSSSNEIILHKVSEIDGSERTLEKTTAHLHCLKGITGNYLVTIWIVDTQTLYFEMYYFIT